MKNNWPKKKSIQWRIIIFTSLLLLFGKDISNKISDWFFSSQLVAYATAQLQASAQPLAVPSNQLVVEIKNDTQNDYIIASKLKAGYLYYRGNSLLNGEAKTFTISSGQTKDKKAFGDIIFTSSPINGAKNTICQVVHILNYDLKNALEINNQPLKVKLSSIASRLDCKNSFSVQHENLNVPDENP